MNTNKLIRWCYIIIGSFFFLVFFFVYFPWNIHTIVSDDYQLLKTTVYSALDYDHQQVKNIDVPKNITLIARFLDDQTIYVKGEYHYDDYVAPYIEYGVTLSHNFEVTDTSPEEFSVRGYMVKATGLIVLLDCILAVFIPLPILFVVALIMDFISYMKNRKIILHSS